MEYCLCFVKKSRASLYWTKKNLSILVLIFVIHWEVSQTLVVIKKWRCTKRFTKRQLKTSYKRLEFAYEHSNKLGIQFLIFENMYYFKTLVLPNWNMHFVFSSVMIWYDMFTFEMAIEIYLNTFVKNYCPDNE